MKKLKLEWLKAFRAPLIAVTIGLFFGGVVMAFSGTNPITGIIALLKGGYGSTYALVTTLTRATPILFAALAASLAWGSGYSSMGAGGQMVLGALVCAIIAPLVPGPGWLVCLVSIAAAVLTGMAWSLLSAYISERFATSLLIITLMCNYLADGIASYFTTYVFKDPFGVDASAIQTQKLTVGVLPKLIGTYSLHTGFLLALLAAVLLWFVSRKTRFGYQAKMNGLNVNFARYGGVPSVKMMLLTLLICGGIAGLGGAIEVLGTRLRYVDGMITSPGYAWSGIIASLMAGNHPIGAIISSIFLAGLTTGGATVERQLGVASEVTLIIQGIITLLITAQLVIKWKKGEKS
ncbi:MAG: ABC transporter permease [Erysipelotrichaceae bacterium]|jgi:simple sugar transport system permease protein|nr:ABC transporter permease [Erysipelotrichaceae bacterium]